MINENGTNGSQYLKATDNRNGQQITETETDNRIDINLQMQTYKSNARTYLSFVISIRGLLHLFLKHLSLHHRVIQLGVCITNLQSL